MGVMRIRRDEALSSVGTFGHPSKLNLAVSWDRVRPSFDAVSVLEADLATARLSFADQLHGSAEC